MIPSYRARFNEQFTPAAHAAFRSEMERQAGVPIEFVLSETPCFFPAALLETFVAAAQDMIASLLGNRTYLDAANAVVPPRFRLVNGETSPTFLQVDFGFVRGRDGFEGRLVELQAFPSLYAFQSVLAETAIRHYRLEGLTRYLGGLDRRSYLALLRRAIVAGHDPEEVVLLEIDPKHQKTRPDFELTEQLLGVRAIDVHDVVQVGRRLFARRGERLTPISRIYNRMIPDEVERLGLSLPIALNEDLDVEWTGGPDWYFRISKFSIPYLRHPWVPETHVLADLTTLPADRERWLLKPLFSFAGSGIVFAPTDAQIDAIPREERRNYILQERIAFEPVIETPHGPTQAEVRLMFVRDGDSYRAVAPLVRMGRGKMMGVDHNKGLSWVGASSGLVLA